MPRSSAPPGSFSEPATGSSRFSNLAGLDHPLPVGMRDLLPVEAERRARVARRVLETFELFAYQPVTLPAFEYAAVIERGLGDLEPASVLRFVEPESGEVVVLRPDMTPQVARLVATRLSELPAPARLYYQGSVLRRRRERARTHQQTPQAGVELVGEGAPNGDLEVLEVATAAVRAAGLSDFVVDLAHAGIASALLRDVPRDALSGLVEALTSKDAVELVRRAERAGLRGRELSALAALPELHGTEEVFRRADSLLADTDAAAAARQLEALWRRASQRQWAPRFIVDLGETRTFEYYTGALFLILAEGPGQPLASGGRYDELYGRFGAPRPAAGCAIDLDNLGWALERSGASVESRLRLLVAGAEPAVASTAAALRARGLSAAAHPGKPALEYARAWHYSHVLEVGAGGEAELRVVDGAESESITADDVAQLAARVAERLRAG